MKILAWNVERGKRGAAVLAETTRQYNADIIILTETTKDIDPGLPESIATTELYKGYDGIDYKAGENRTTIWSKYKIDRMVQTYDDYTSICVEVGTPFGKLTVYGIIIGVFGGNGKASERYKSDLRNTDDVMKLPEQLCIAGDLNTTFSGWTYPSSEGRNALNELFKQKNLVCLTCEIENSVNHIALSKSFIEGRNISIETWNHDKKLSDHIGVCVTIN
ncbi:endonuclease/exonuclease/phosphatase family protein [Flavobacterium sp. J372]|uniref:endonuclease/exonuclease/phosphatase family protein n=1 Tax=Flavobacterium sp. J372 TaxID=2898436 RepID=UPI002150C7F3|nr:endonuclease/exonuclease/phosphatase family protein [Flavobacterium sp. J372]MCR5860957.1 endonuclease/exonuclease/phosphatase family protein [Flavobacterium sp. J372]